MVVLGGFMNLFMVSILFFLILIPSSFLYILASSISFDYNHQVTPLHSSISLVMSVRSTTFTIISSPSYNFDQVN